MTMRIYTKTGDRGETGLFGGQRVSKADTRVEAYGEVDELNAVLGIARSAEPPEDLDALLAQLQSQLFELGAQLATPSYGEAAAGITGDDVTWLEGRIDAAEEELPRLKSFVLPGGSSVAAALHLARTVCRRAERRVVRLIEDEVGTGTEPLIYLNRLADLLFVLARLANHRAGVADVPWQAR